MENAATATSRLRFDRTPVSDSRVLRRAPTPHHENTAGSLLGNTASNRLPYASRLNPIEGQTSAAPSSVRVLGRSPALSSIRLAVRKSASPRKLPAIGVVIWSLIDGGSRSPATSQSALPATS